MYLAKVLGKVRLGAVVIASALAVLLGVASSASIAQAQSNSFNITVGTGGVSGVYYPAGGGICRLVNMGRRDHGIRCLVESTDGSAYNLRAVRDGKLNIGVAQSDVQYAMVNGTGGFVDDQGASKVRALFSLHQELFTVVARADAGVRMFDDLKGKRVNIGNPGSGQRATMERLMRVKGWTQGDFGAVKELSSTEQSKALCDGEVDAIVFTVGNPNASIMEATATCDTVLVPVDDAGVSKLLQDYPYYQKGSVPGGMYRGADKDTPTFGFSATVVASAKTPDEVIYRVVKSVFDNLDSFKRLHPAFKNLDKAEMVTKGLSARLHPGAIHYFQETGLLP